MIQIPDHPIIRCIEETGYPPWYLGKEDEADVLEEEPESDCAESGD